MEIEFQCTENDYKNFYKLHYKNEFQKRIIGFFLLSLLIGYVFAGDPFNLTKFFYGVITLIFLLIMGYYIVPYIVAISKMKKLIKKDPRYLEKKKLVLTDEGLYFETTKKNSSLKWESIASINSNIKFILLFLADKSLYLIPKRAFSTDNDSINFIGIVRNRIEKNNNRIKATPNTSNKKPPYLLGLLCLIPLIGAFVGLFFIILGITRFKDKWFTLIGVFGIAFTVIIYSSLFYASKNLSFFKSGFKELLQKELNNLVKEIEFYKMENGKYPDSLQQLTKDNPQIFIYDPIQTNQSKTNNKFQYQNLGKQYRLFSSGIDGIPNTNDDLYPQISEKIIDKVGLIKYNIKHK